MNSLKGKKVLITGSSRGIGKATAILAAKSGADVMINYYSSKKDAFLLKKQLLGLGVKAYTVKGDVSKPKDAKRIVKTARKKLKGIDILVNNAGVLSALPLTKEKIKKLHQVIDINLKGQINLTYYTVPAMKRKGGVIVNIASQAATENFPNLAVYTASKSGVVGFTRNVAQELKEFNIRIYAVSPGAVATDMTGGQGMPPEKIANRVIEVASESLNLKSGEETQLFK